MSFLSLRGVTMRYGAVVAVDAIDLDIAEATRTAIVGASGCGKTTLLRLIGGFERPVEGRITLGEQVLADEHGATPAHLRNIGYVTQDGALFPHLSVTANVGFGLPREEPDRPARIVALMEAVGLSTRLGERRPHELSGGQQQRVALARALARRPGIMLLDEPFSALDAGLRDSMRDMVGEVLGGAGVTTILVTHDQTEALSFADHLVVMRDGKLVQAGPPADLYGHPGDPHIAAFLGDAIILDAKLDNGFAECTLGRIAVAGNRPNGEARIMLRPEQVAVHPLDAGFDLSGYAVVGKVVGQSFRGPTRKLVVEFTSGSTETPGQAARRLTFLTLSSASPAVGSSVRVEVTSPAHVFS